MTTSTRLGPAAGVAGRPTIVDDDKRRAIIARRGEQQSLREDRSGVGISTTFVHRIINEHESQDSQ